MWRLLVANSIPPTRKSRYCCERLKECHGVGRLTVTGVRWAESAKRKAYHGVVDFVNKPLSTQRKAKWYNATIQVNKAGSVIMNDDNDGNRRMVEFCYRTHKTLVNPIVDWTDEDVWEFIRDRNLPYCSLYDEGFKRLGCIGCPLSGRKGMERDFERWPAYRRLYMIALQKSAEAHPGRNKVLWDSFEPDEEELTVIKREREREDKDPSKRWPLGFAIFCHWIRMGAT